MKKVKRKTLVSIITIIFILSTILAVGDTSASGQGEIEPQFTVKIDEIDPSPAEVGQDVTVKGIITPKSFTADVKEKEIVLVLDTSGSMNDEVEIEEGCKEERGKYCLSHERYNCPDCNMILYDVGIISKVWYCSTHERWTEVYDKWHKPTKCLEHEWKDDYCERHNKAGAHNDTSPKIEELKKAANAFIEKMKDVPNLKIGIVTFAKNANIVTEHKGNEYLYNVKDNELTDIINEIEADGGTNTGEGLRKAAYILSGDNNENINKTVVLMSDGVPTFYSYYITKKHNRFENEWDYYRQLNNSDPSVGGPGNESTAETKKYARYMATILKDRVNNAYSIGYGLEDSGGYNTLEEIHSSMSDDKNNFFPSDNGAIDKVFDNIGNEILKKFHSIDDMKMELNVGEKSVNVSVGDGQQGIVKIPSISYKTDGNMNSSGKVTYRADPVPFEFKIKGEVPGEFNIFHGGELDFTWNGKQLSQSCDISPISIKFYDDTLPKIDATLNETTPRIANLGEEVKITYDITPHSFKYANKVNVDKSEEKKYKPTDVVFVMDVSSKMKFGWCLDLNSKEGWRNGNRIEELVSAIGTNITSSLNTKEYNVNYGLVTYADDTVSYVDMDTSDKFNSKLDELVAVDNDGDNIGSALLNANNILENSHRDSNKYIVIMASDDVSYTDSDITQLKDKGYNFISCDMSYDGSKGEELKKMHHNLGASDRSYYTWMSYGDFASEIQRTIKDSLVYGEIDSDENSVVYAIDDAQLNFHIGDKFSVVEGSEAIYTVEDNSKEKVSFKKTGDGNTWTFELPKIMYKRVKDTYEYSAKAFQISFVVKPLEIGELNFNENNTITHRPLNKWDMTSEEAEIKKISREIETPTIKVSPTNITHGVYEGYNGKEHVVSKEKISLAKGASVTFAGKMEIGNESAKVLLNVNSHIKLDGEPKVYIIGEDGKLGLLGIMSTNDSNYTYDIPKVDNEKPARKLLIIYDTELPQDNGTYENTIIVNNQMRKAQIQVSGESLPDLF